ncbi:MAG TPA: DUF4282 domain-containing protein [Gemmataceae bacterium]|nr:DUF4282 domain-containing protein [Gemmataceae bacterium]
MPLVIACPTCQQKIRAPESVIGRQIKCPQCKTPFIAQDTSSLGAPPIVPGGTIREQLPSHQQPDGAAATAATQGWSAPTPDELGEAETESRGPAKQSRGSFLDYLLFRRMVTPWIIIVVFYLGVAGIIIGGIIQFVSAVYLIVDSRGHAAAVGIAVLYLLGALLGSIFFLVLWRVYCEVIATFFRILDNVREINEQLRERKGQV